MKASLLIKRFLTPPLVVSFVYWRRYGAKVSPRAEVDLTDNLVFGSRCVVGSFTKIKAASGPLRIGNDVQIATQCFIGTGAGGLTIGDYTMIGPLTCIVSVNYSYARLDQPVALQPKTSKGIRIGRGVWIGAGCMIVDGADIGANVIVTPNSVVAGRVPENTIVQGNPAEVVFTRR
jgi:acetyltransferase-like isoleucine patch superfamily enzyme